MLRMCDVQGKVCWGCGMWDVDFEEVEFSRCGMFPMLEFWNVGVQQMGCLECRMFRRWKISDV